MKHRLFTAIDLPDTTVSEIVTLQPQLEKLKAPLVWEKRPHMTLNFLGQIPDDEVPLVKKALTQATQSAYQFTLQPLYVETLYSRHEPTILYLSLAKSEELNDLHKSLIVNLESITPQPRKFLPHITIAHLKRTDPVSTKRFMDLISDFESPPFSPFTVDKITLYQSLITQAGTTHQKLATFMLQSLLL